MIDGLHVIHSILRAFSQPFLDKKINELHKDTPNSATSCVLLSGVNGELPNMDLLNVAVIHHERQGVGVRLDTCSAPLHGDELACLDAVGQAAIAVDQHLPKKSDVIQGYFDRLFGMLGFMGSAVMGPSGPHAHFLRHSVDALTIRGLGRTRGEPAVTSKRPVSLGSGVSTTAAVVSIIRSVSNLEEELHHSFFSYIMLSKAAFVSIGVLRFSYMLEVSIVRAPAESLVPFLGLLTNIVWLVGVCAYCMTKSSGTSMCFS